MKLAKAKCPYCGNVRKNEDDVNMLKTFCGSCSTKRHTIAQQYFNSRSVTIIKNGKYVLSKRVSSNRGLKKI